MKTVKVSELSGAALDWAVATCEGYTELRMNPHRFAHFLIMTPPQSDYGPVQLADLNYSTDWSQGGPIIEREKVDIKWICVNNCRACSDWLDEKFSEAFGSTPLIAAMRCYVASKLGDTIEIPDEL